MCPPFGGIQKIAQSENGTFLRCGVYCVGPEGAYSKNCLLMKRAVFRQ